MKTFRINTNLTLITSKNLLFIALSSQLGAIDVASYILIYYVSIDINL
jgi:hypothetical protein